MDIQDLFSRVGHLLSVDNTGRTEESRLPKNLTSNTADHVVTRTGHLGIDGSVCFPDDGGTVLAFPEPAAVNAEVAHSWVAEMLRHLPLRVVTKNGERMGTAGKPETPRSRTVSVEASETWSSNECAGSHGTDVLHEMTGKTASEVSREDVGVAGAVKKRLDFEGCVTDHAVDGMGREGGESCTVVSKALVPQDDSSPIHRSKQR